MRNLFFFIFIYSQIYTYAKTINGIVKDFYTNEILEFCGINELGISNSTITNSNGEFIINTKNNIVIRNVGYCPDTIDISNISANTFIVYLKPSIIDIPQVAINQETYPKGMVNKAFNKIINNVERIVYCESVYRQLMKINGKCVEYQEILYNNKINCNNTIGVFIKNGRYACKKESKILYKNFTDFTIMFAFLEDKVIHNKVFPYEDYLMYKFDLTKRYTNEVTNISVVKITRKYENTTYSNFKSLYINEKDSTLIKLIQKNNLPIHNFKNPLLNVSNIETICEVEYAYFKGVTYISHVKFSSVFNLKYLFRKPVKVEIYSNSVYYNYSLKSEISEIEYKLNFNLSDRYKIDSIPYNQQYWINNSYYKRTNEEDSIINNFNSNNSFGTFNK